MRKYLNKLFIYMILASISYVYYVNVSVVWLGVNKSNMYSKLYIALFTVVIILMVWSLFKTMFTDPGKVPQNWGFYLNDPEQKKRRFCLICHIFKPERCHVEKLILSLFAKHCSACDRCVLNMDHHCPWINNCVGFQNRKFFMQMLFYTILSTGIGGLGLIYGFLSDVELILSKAESNSLVDGLMILSALGICGLAFFLISMFFKFHVDLVLSNRTTIENLERKRAEDTGQTANEVNQFDINKYFNWVQVFGTNKLLWFFPIPSDSGRPVGDGVVWPKKNVPMDSYMASPKLNSPTQNHVPSSGFTQDNSQTPVDNGWKPQSGITPIESYLFIFFKKKKEIECMTSNNNLVKPIIKDVIKINLYHLQTSLATIICSTFEILSLYFFYLLQIYIYFFFYFENYYYP